MLETGALTITGLDAAAPAAARLELAPCCASRRWIEEIIEGRPYATPAALAAASDAALERLDWADVLAAVTAHPRIGAAPAGTGRESQWSRGEQAAAAGAGETAKHQLSAGNRAYEERFGHVFLICASGRSAEQILAALKDRMTHDPLAERDVVRAELAAIVRLRLATAFA